MKSREFLRKSELSDLSTLQRLENVLDKAGTYGIQGYAGVYIPKIEGNYFNVMGAAAAFSA